MGYILRQATATTIPIGQLIDDTDFKTRESSVTYNQSGVDCAIMKNNGTWDAVTITDTAGANDWVNKGDGFYTLELTATQTDTVGNLVISYFATGILPWTDTFYVVEEAIFDAFYASSATGALPVSSGGIAAAAFASGAIDAAALAADAVDEIVADILVTPSQKIVTDASGYVTSNLNGDLTATMKASVNTEVDNALNTAIPASPVADSVNERVKAIDDKLPTNYIMGSSVVTAKDDEIDAIKAKTDNLPALPAASGDVPSAATVADAVWDEASTGHTDAGKAGAQMWTDIDAIAIDVAGLDGAAMRGTDNAALASVCTETRLAELDAANLITDVANVKTDTAAILADTGTDGVVVAAASKTGYALSTAGVDAILDDTPSAELASIPTTTSSLRLMIQFIFSYFRNKRTITSTTETLYKEDAGTLLGTATVSDDGTTKTKGEMG